jgi:Tol biopolymer transport system component
MDATAFRTLAGTEGVTNLAFSEDGKWVLFLAPISDRTTQRQLSKVPFDGTSPPVPVVKVDDAWGGRPMWLRSGDILLSTAGGKEYVRIPAGGGPPSKPLPLRSPGFDGAFFFRKLLPGDRGVLLATTSYEEGVYYMGVGVLDLKSGKVRVLIRDGGSPEYAPTGHLLFSRRDALFAVPFDLGRLEVKGSPVALQGGLRVAASWGNAEFQSASDGTLLHVLGGNVGQNRHAVIVDAEGKVSDWSGERQPFEAFLTASPDGNHFASVIADAGAIYEIWVSEKGRPTSRRAVAVPGVDCGGGPMIWSPDGTRFAFGQAGRGDVNGTYIANADWSGTPRRLVKTDESSPVLPTSWSPDGSQLLLTRFRGGKFELLVALTSAAQEVEAKPVFGGHARRGGGFFSPDGRMIAYLSDETGKLEAFVCAWGGGGPIGQPLIVSQGGVSRVLAWSRDSKRVYFITEQDQAMSSMIAATPRLSATPPALAWDLDALRIVSGLVDLLPDGKLLAIQKGEGEDEIKRFDLALNFFDEMRAKVRDAQKR